MPIYMLFSLNCRSSASPPLPPLGCSGSGARGSRHGAGGKSSPAGIAGGVVLIFADDHLREQARAGSPFSIKRAGSGAMTMRSVLAYLGRM